MTTRISQCCRMLDLAVCILLLLDSLILMPNDAWIFRKFPWKIRNFQRNPPKMCPEETLYKSLVNLDLVWITL